MKFSTLSLMFNTSRQTSRTTEQSFQVGEHRDAGRMASVLVSREVGRVASGFTSRDVGRGHARNLWESPIHSPMHPSHLAV